MDLSSLSNLGQIILIVVLTFIAHFGVVMLRVYTNRYSKKLNHKAQSKWRSIATLGSSILLFIIYFVALGTILQEFGIPVTAYVASASVVGLAVAFGSQRLVQDVLTGLTLVFSDLLDVGDMAEVGGQTGYVRSIGMRFVILQNSLGAKVHIPNHTIVNVVNYFKGYVNCTVDVNLPQEEKARDGLSSILQGMIKSFEEQYPGIIVGDTSVKNKLKTSTGKEFSRVKFRIWPGRGSIIETNFKQELLKRIQILDHSYAEWMIAITYESEKKNRRVRN